MAEKGNARRFEEQFSPHLDAAYNLARWMTGHDGAAQDIVQESCLRAFRFLHRFDGQHPRAWLLAIVRNQSYTWLQKNAAAGYSVPIDDDDGMFEPALSHSETPEVLAMRLEDGELVHRALEELPPALREVIVLKDIEDLAYRDIADVIGAPIGTVMSRLSRGRGQLKTIIVGMRGASPE
jgi:RNA polymerase sigma-70 factor (ECF subfamily)